MIFYLYPYKEEKGCKPEWAWSCVNKGRIIFRVEGYVSKGNAKRSFKNTLKNINRLTFIVFQYDENEKEEADWGWHIIRKGRIIGWSEGYVTKSNAERSKESTIKQLQLLTKDNQFPGLIEVTRNEYIEATN